MEGGSLDVKRQKPSWSQAVKDDAIGLIGTLGLLALLLLGLVLIVRGLFTGLTGSARPLSAPAGFGRGVLGRTVASLLSFAVAYRRDRSVMILACASPRRHLQFMKPRRYMADGRAEPGTESDPVAIDIRFDLIPWRHRSGV